VAERIEVVAAVVERDGRFLVTKRLDGTHLGGYWEFPGGKVNSGEVLEDALRREMNEELRSGIVNLRKIFQTSQAYPERAVELHFFRGDLTSEPVAALGQDIRWVARGELAGLEFPPADAELIAMLMDSERRDAGS
jgi:8-oxo-dGTP diphosphatase